MKTFLLAMLVGFVVTLAAIVINGWQGDNCEALYNAFSQETDMSHRDAIFAEGIDNGCFHYN